MAADSDAKRNEERSCCAVLKGRYLKLEEKRNALRQAVKLLEQQIDKFQIENANLKKAHEEERIRAELELEAKLKESAIRVELENEILNFKSQVILAQEKSASRDQLKDDEAVQLQTRLSDAEVEIKQLKELLEEEKKRGDLEQKNAKEQKKKVAEAWELVNTVKTKAEEEKKLADIERTQADEFRRNLEALKIEMNEAKEELASNRTKTEEALKSLEVQKRKAEELKKYADIEIEKAEKQKKFAEEQCKKAISEKCRSDKLSQDLEEQKQRNGVLEKEIKKLTLALEKVIKEKECDNAEKAKVIEEKFFEEVRTKASEEKISVSQLSQQLEEEKQRNVALKKEIENIKVSLKLEMAEEEKKLADIERTQADEYRCSLEALRTELNEAKEELASNRAKAEEALRNLEFQKQKVEEQKKRADLEIEKAEKQRKFAEEQSKKAITEKCLSDKLSQDLEEEKRRNGVLEKEIKKIRLALEKANKEKADLEKAKVEEEKKLIEEERKKASEEKNCASQLSLQLEEEKEKNEALKKEIRSMKASIKLEKARKKKHTDKEIKKAKKLRKCAEEERTKAINEKNRFNQLAQQLDDERQKNEALRKEIQEIMSARQLAKDKPILHDHNGDAVNAGMVALKEQLKLEKIHVKHAKRVAKLREVQNDLMKEEIYGLKKDFINLAQRLNILDGYFFPGTEGIDASAKLHNCLKHHRSKLKNEHAGKDHSEFYCLRENELAKTCPNLDGFGHFGSKLGRAGPFSCGCCRKRNSGICFELESLVGGSVRSKSQNSAIFSTSTSISDRPQVGSQGVGAFSVVKPANFAKGRLDGITVPRISNGVTEMIANENLGVVAENNIRSVVDKNICNPCLNSEHNDSIDAAGKEPAQRRRKRGFHDIVESIEYMHSKDKKLARQIEKNLSALCDMLTLKSNTPSLKKRKLNNLADGRGQVSACMDDVDEGRQSSGKKKYMHQKQELVLKPCDKSEGLTKGVLLETDSIKNAEVSGLSVSPVNCARDVARISMNEKTKDLGCIQEHERSFEDMVNENYLKLLELDNEADEEKFRIAVEMPLSPTLPEIGMHNLELSAICEYINHEAPNKKANLVLCSSAGIDNMEMDTGQTCLDQSDTNREEAANCIHGYRGEMEDPCAIRSNPIQHEHISKCCVIFGRDKDKISRIISFVETCISQSCMVVQRDWVIHHVIHALSKEEGLLPEEKASAFLSLMLYNFSLVASVKFCDFLTSAASLCSNSFAIHVKTVMLDRELRCLLLKSCLLDVLFAVTEDFLINRKVLLYSMSHDAQASSNPGSVIFLCDGTTIYVSERTAAVDQLVAGSILLASMSAALGQIGIICEASYRIVRIHRSDSSLVLTILHVFASLCGKEYITLDEYSLIMTVIKSIVRYLEKGNNADGSCAFFSSASENCLFSEGAVTLDEVTQLLLEKLQYYAGPVMGHQHLCKSFMLSKERTHRNVEADKLNPNCVITKSFMDFSDYLSLLELVACFVSWDWIWSKLIPPLLKMLESSSSEKFLAAIIILLGHLGRLGLDSSGKELMGVEDLRCTLCSFLDQSSRKLGFPAQCAIIHALINFNNIDFAELVQSNDNQAGTSQSGRSNLIRTWFLQLGEEQKSLSLELFQTADLHES